MIIWLKIFFESTRQAFGSLFANKLRTFLSLLGIMIGIFCIITVKSAVDSLEDSLVNSFNELGSDVIYIDKNPWNEDPSRNYWKYAKRPNASIEDYKSIVSKSKLAEAASFCVFTGGKTIKYESNAITNAFIMGSTYEYLNIKNLNLVEGRYFTQTEFETGANKIILGYKVYEELFKGMNGVGKMVRLFGQNFQVIGYLESEGNNMFNFINFDNVIWLNINSIKRFVNINETSNLGVLLNVKAKKGIDLKELKAETASILRASRKIKPLAEDNFAINELSVLSNVLDTVFGVINFAGFIIGIFALIVGMFSVSNIMFVSVKERTNIIGIKKALGAKRNVILAEFLIESVILCILGGLVGLCLVFVVLKILTSVTPFEMTLSLGNMLQGVLWSIGVGIISGLVPAIQAASMDPVEAIRS